MRNFINAALLGVAYAAVDYSESGANWEGLCATGKEQSPIDLIDQQMENKLAIKMEDYKNYGEDSGLKIKEKQDETLLMEFPSPADQGTMVLTFGDGTKNKYNPYAATVHAPSEHAVVGNIYDMELQLWHEAADGSGEIAVLAFLFSAEDDEESPFVADMLRKIPSSGGVGIDKLDLADLLDKYILGHYFSYDGSMTTPPCTEGIKWTVIEAPIPISKAQKKIFDDYYKNDDDFADGNGNNRALQPINDRVLIENWAGECPEGEDDHCFGGDHSHGHGHGHDHDHDGASMLGAAGAALLAIAAMQI